MFCTNCGRKLNEDAAFCPNCGQRNSHFNNDTTDNLKRLLFTNRKGEYISPKKSIEIFVKIILIMISCVMIFLICFYIGLNLYFSNITKEDVKQHEKNQIESYFDKNFPNSPYKQYFIDEVDKYSY